jgi:hypothetical protein
LIDFLAERHGRVVTTASSNPKVFVVFLIFSEIMEEYDNELSNPVQGGEFLD